MPKIHNRLHFKVSKCGNKRMNAFLNTGRRICTFLVHLIAVVAVS